MCLRPFCIYIVAFVYDKPSPTRKKDENIISQWEVLGIEMFYGWLDINLLWNTNGSL